jgi:hypothetical protein
MSIFGSLLKTAVDVVTLPIDIVKDAATLGGTLEGKTETYTGKKLKRLDDDIESISDEAGKL